MFIKMVSKNEMLRGKSGKRCKISVDWRICRKKLRKMKEMESHTVAVSPKTPDIRRPSSPKHIAGFNLILLRMTDSFL